MGEITHKSAINRPTLALPKWITPVLTSEPPAPSPDLHPLLTAAGDQAQAMMKIRAGMTDERFLEWLEGGLRQARLFAARDEPTMERVIEAAVEKHGSIIGAMRAGALS